MSSPRASRRALAMLAVPVIAGAVLLAPAAATAAAGTGVCTVTAADLTWGFKESFRSYISGSIAKGDWEVEDGATYETPTFGWSGGTGDYDAEAATGQIAFAGGIHFAGHGGLLDTRVANPTLVFAGPGSAQLLLDISGVSMDDALAGDDTVETSEQVPFVEIDLSDAVVSEADGTLTVTAVDAPTAITEDGFAAFGNYEPGTAFDPITVTVTAACADPEPVAEPSVEPSAEPGAADTPAAGQTALADAETAGAGSSAGTIALVVGVAAAILATAATVFVARRRTGATDTGATDAGATDAGATDTGATGTGSTPDASTEDGATPGADQ